MDANIIKLINEIKIKLLVEEKKMIFLRIQGLKKKLNNVEREELKELQEKFNFKIYNFMKNKIKLNIFEGVKIEDLEKEIIKNLTKDTYTDISELLLNNKKLYTIASFIEEAIHYLVIKKKSSTNSS